MHSKLKKISLIFGVVLILILIAGLVANSIVKGKIESALEHLFEESVEFAYQDLSVNALVGNLSISEISLIKDTSNIQIENIKIKHLNWLKYLTSKDFAISAIEITNPKVQYINHTQFFKKNNSNNNFKESKIQIEITRFSVDNAQLTVLDSVNKSEKQSIHNMDFVIENIVLNEGTLQSKIPFNYDSFSLNIDSLFSKSGQYENVNAKNISFNLDSISAENIKFKTKYQKSKYDQLLEKERDHYDVSVEGLKLKAWNYEFKNDSLFFKADLLSINNPHAIIYRNKLIPDDGTIKQFYGNALRSLPFKLGIEECTVTNAKIKYEEKTQETQPAGELYFDELNAKISRLGNVYKNEPTALKINGVFMKSAPIDVDWKFWVNDASEKFTFKARIDELPADKLSTFTKSNLSIIFTGRLKATYFSIFGTKNSSEIDMKMKYNNLKIKMLNKENSKINSFASSVINLFVSKKSESKNDEFREANAKVTPDRTKSIFNYLWKNIKTALKKILT